MTAKEASFAPMFNCMCSFNAGSNTWHGNPVPVAYTDYEHRMSIALYFYTATWDSTRKAHSTIFKPWSGTADKCDRLEIRQKVMKDILPPAVFHRIAHQLQRAGI